MYKGASNAGSLVQQGRSWAAASLAGEHGGQWRGQAGMLHRGLRDAEERVRQRLPSQQTGAAGVGNEAA
jgi:hypothetical protein